MINGSKSGRGKGEKSSFSPVRWALIILSATVLSAFSKYAVSLFLPSGESEAERLIFALLFYGISFLLPALILNGLFLPFAPLSKNEENKSKKQGLEKTELLLFVSALTSPFFAGAVKSFFITAEKNALVLNGDVFDMILCFFAVAVIPGICEELFYRKALTSGVSVVFGKAWGVLFPAVLFGMNHYSAGSCVTALFVGIFYGLLSNGGENWKKCALCHFINNGIAFFNSFFSSCGMSVAVKIFEISGYAFAGVFLLSGVLYFYHMSRRT